MAYRLTKEALEVIKSDNDLALEIANVLGVKWTAMPSMVNKNSRRFIEPPVLVLIAGKLGKSMTELTADASAKVVHPV